MSCLSLEKTELCFLSISLTLVCCSADRCFTSTLSNNHSSLSSASSPFFSTTPCSLCFVRGSSKDTLLTFDGTLFVIENSFLLNPLTSFPLAAPSTSTAPFPATAPSPSTSTAPSPTRDLGSVNFIVFSLNTDFSSSDFTSTALSTSCDFTLSFFQIVHRQDTGSGMTLLKQLQHGFLLSRLHQFHLD